MPFAKGDAYSEKTRASMQAMYKWKREHPGETWVPSSIRERDARRAAKARRHEPDIAFAARREARSATIRAEKLKAARDAMPHLVESVRFGHDRLTTCRCGDTFDGSGGHRKTSMTVTVIVPASDETMASAFAQHVYHHKRLLGVGAWRREGPFPVEVVTP